MNTREWLSERVSRLRAPAAVPQPAPVRSTNERLKARLRQGEEALSPRALRQKLDELKGIVDPLVSEVEGGRRAGELIDWYASASPAHRRDLWLLMSERFVADPEASFEAAGLTREERDMVRKRDWRALIHYGVIFFILEKLGAVVGISNLHIYATMRGQTLEEFQKTRNAPGALYSVAGKDAAPQAWDKASQPAGH